MASGEMGSAVMGECDLLDMRDWGESHYGNSDRNGGRSNVLEDELKNLEKEEEKLSGGGSSYTFNYNATAAAHKAGGGLTLGEGPLAQQGDVKAHHLLVLLLRLRQICNHPGLIQSMLDTETKQSEGIEDQDGEDMDLISAMEDINLNKEKSSVDKTENILDKANPVFATDSTSSKINMVVDELIKLKEKKKNEGKVY